MKLSIIIKAYNEEAKIATAIESSMASIARLIEQRFISEGEAEVVMADSLSRDQTTEIAGRYPIRIVQLKNISDRGCGAGAQLAFQHSFGHYVYLLDGDMELRPDFLPFALAAIEADPRIAGVGGIIHDIENDNLEYRARAARAGNAFTAGPTDRLDCGGLYRRAAAVDVGYFSDRNLHSFEEMDLGARLRAAGWRLIRIEVVAVDHYTHTAGNYQLMWRRMSSGYALGSGEVFRGALFRNHFVDIARQLNILKVFAFVALWLLVILACLVLNRGFLGLLLATIIIAGPIAIMSLRRRSAEMGFYSVAAWVMNSVGFLRGFFRPRIDPTLVLPSIVLKDVVTPDMSYAGLANSKMTDGH